MRLALIIFCIFFCTSAYSQEYNNFSLYAIEPENFFANPYKRSTPQPYEAYVRHIPETPIEWREADAEYYKRRSYIDKAEILGLRKPEPQSPPHQLTALEKRAMLEHLIYTRYYESDEEPLYDALDLLPEYYCSAVDEKLMSIYLDMLWANRYIVDNHDWLALAECFICRPADMLDSLSGYSKESKRLYSAQIQRGMELLLSNRQQYQELKQVLDLVED